jgi:alpha-tubulin suppressor-like RCC1 family protein
MIPLPIIREKVKDVALGYNFVVLLSKNGILFTFGKNNSHG